MVSSGRFTNLKWQTDKSSLTHFFHYIYYQTAVCIIFALSFVPASFTVYLIEG